MPRRGKLLKEPLDCGGRVDVDAGEIGASIGSSVDWIGEAPGDEVVVGAGAT